jgi:hypothetical protein
LSGGIGHNQPATARGKKKRPETANEERLRSIILNARDALTRQDIGKAIALLEGVYQPDFDDSLKGTGLEARAWGGPRARMALPGSIPRHSSAEMPSKLLHLLK